jgi:ATP-dependent exoDNAse (exonuclease V) beta subunit
VKRAFLEPLLGLLDKRELIAKLIATEVNPAVKEFRELEARLLKHAKTDPNLRLWFQKEQREYNAQRDDFEKDLSRLDAIEMTIQLSQQTDEEVLEAIEHADKLAELTNRKIELHVEYLRRVNARLKAKIAEIAKEAES